MTNIPIAFSIIASDDGQVLATCKDFQDLLQHLKTLSAEISMSEFFKVCDIVAGDDL